MKCLEMNSTGTEGKEAKSEDGTAATAAPASESPVDKRWESKLDAVVRFLETYRPFRGCANPSDDVGGSITDINGFSNENAISLIDEEDEDYPDYGHVSWLKQQELAETWDYLSYEQQTKLRLLELHHPTWFREHLWAPFFFGHKKTNHKRPLGLPTATAVAANSNKKRRVEQPPPPPKFKFKKRTKSSQSVAQSKATALAKSPVSTSQLKQTKNVAKSPGQPKKAPALSNLPSPVGCAPLSIEQKEKEYLRLTDNNTRGVTYSTLTWMGHYERLKVFKKLFGHTDVKIRWKVDPKLGKWVSRQRDGHNAPYLTQERIRLLKEVGFTWSLRDQRPRRKTNGDPTEPSMVHLGVSPNKSPSKSLTSSQSTKQSSPTPKKSPAHSKSDSDSAKDLSPFTNIALPDLKNAANAKGRASENKHKEAPIVEVGRQEYPEDDINEYGVQEDDDNGQFDDCDEEDGFECLLPGQAPPFSREKPDTDTGGYVQIVSPVRHRYSRPSTQCYRIVTPPCMKNGGHQTRVIAAAQEERSRIIIAGYHLERAIAEQKKCLPLSHVRVTTDQPREASQEVDTGTMFPSLAEVKAIFQAIEARIVVTKP